MKSTYFKAKESNLVDIRNKTLKISSTILLKVKVTQSCPTLCNPMDSPWNSPGQNTGVDSLSLPQGNLPKSGMEPRSPTLQGILYQLSYQGSPIKGEAAKNHQRQDERDQRSSSRLEDPPPKMRLRKCKLCPHSNLVRDPTFDPHQIL